MKARSNILLIFQAVPGCLPWGVIGSYLNDYLSQDKGFSISVATLVIVIFNIGGGAGLVGGGAFGQLLYNWKREWMLVMCGLCTLASPGPMYFLINADLQKAGLGITLTVALLAGFLSAASAPNVRAAVLNVNGEWR